MPCLGKDVRNSTTQPNSAGCRDREGQNSLGALQSLRTGSCLRGLAQAGQLRVTPPPFISYQIRYPSALGKVINGQRLLEALVLPRLARNVRSWIGRQQPVEGLRGIMELPPALVAQLLVDAHSGDLGALTGVQ